MSDQAPFRSDALFQTLLATAVDGIIVIDVRGAVRMYSDACERLFGYARNEVVGQNVKMLMPSPYHEEHDGYLARYRRTGERRIIGIGREVTGRRKNGSTFPMYLSVGEGQLDTETIFVGIIHDLSTKHESDTQVRDQAARLGSILETVPDAILTINDQGLIESFSSAAAKLFGYKPEEVLGKNVKMLMPPPYREEHDGYLERYRRTAEKRIIGIGRIVVGRRRDGSTFPMELQVGEAKIGERTLFTGFVRDITERQGTERRLQELQSELLHVSRLSAMGQMAAALAHELNQPLTAIVNYVRIARRVLDGVSDPKVARAQEMIDKAADQTTRAGSIIRRLRDFVEKRATVRAEESINKVVEEAIALALIGSSDANVRVRVGLDASLPTVTIDKVQIQQVLINLIRNSIDAMQAVETRELTITTAVEDDGAVQVSVTDTGPGLSQKVSSRLFQPFVTTKDKGMGVGLAICQAILEAHGGRIWVTRNDGPGVSFRFRLPTSRELSGIDRS